MLATARSKIDIETVAWNRNAGTDSAGLHTAAKLPCRLADLAALQAARPFRSCGLSSLRYCSRRWRLVALTLAFASEVSEHVVPGNYGCRHCCSTFSAICQAIWEPWSLTWCMHALTSTTMLFSAVSAR
jgi:hypothetical protein